MISINMISARRAEHLRMLRWVRALGVASAVAGAAVLAVNIFVRAQIFSTGLSGGRRAGRYNSMIRWCSFSQATTALAVW